MILKCKTNKNHNALYKVVSYDSFHTCVLISIERCLIEIDIAQLFTLR